MKILILKPSSLGDVVQSLPVLRLVKKHRPESEIHWWIDAGLSPLLEGDPDLAGVVRFEKQRWASPVHWLEISRWLQWLRAQNFDWVIDLQGLMRSGIVAWFVNGKLLVGLDEPREGARGFYDIIAPRPSAHANAVDWYLAVLPRLGVPVHGNFTWLPERPSVAAEVRAKWQMDGTRWIALQPGARWRTKRWPIEHFAELLRQLAARFTDTRFVVLGSGEDRPLGEQLARIAPERCLDLTGRTTLPEMVECVRLCDMMVSNDTGPMHVAAALGKPVIGLFGPTDFRRHGPYGQLDEVMQHPLPCSPCGKARCAWHTPIECLTAVTPAMVFEQVCQRLPATG